VNPVLQISNPPFSAVRPHTFLRQSLAWMARFSVAALAPFYIKRVNAKLRPRYLYGSVIQFSTYSLQCGNTTNVLLLPLNILSQGLDNKSGLIYND